MNNQFPILDHRIMQFPMMTMDGQFIALKYFVGIVVYIQKPKRRALLKQITNPVS